MSTQKKNYRAFSGKMILVIIDGAADLPISELDNRTPLAAADIPAMDQLARQGQLATVCCVPTSFEPGSDVAIMSLLGYDPARYHTGRAPIEAAARRVPVKDGEWVFRCNIVTFQGALMKDHSAGGIGDEDAERLVELVKEEFADYPARFHKGVSYRNLMIYEGDAGSIQTTPPHNILGQPWQDHLPTGSGSDVLRDMTDRSQSLFERMDPAEATSLWFWGQGTPARLDSFEDQFGARGAMICAVDLVRGLGNLMGWTAIDVPGATGNIDTNYAGKGHAAIKALQDHDIVCVHVEAPDEAGHQGNWAEKVKSLEEVDRHIVAPLLQVLPRYADWRMLVMPDHPTPCAVKTHTRDAVPLVLAGSDVQKDSARLYSEKEATAQGAPLIDRSEIMERLTQTAQG